MASIVAKRPIVGIVAGVIFAALGMLISSVDSAPGTEKVLWSGLYKVVGYFMLLVALLSFVLGVAGLGKALASRKQSDESAGMK